MACLRNVVGTEREKQTHLSVKWRVNPTAVLKWGFFYSRPFQATAVYNFIIQFDWLFVSLNLPYSD